ncbi:Uncharacterised protein [Mycobacteroides abscessus subsp. abscessus]|nr:Uncharacterised protein [Mycobacteroides abscessus subsp. abscessus]
MPLIIRDPLFFALGCKNWMFNRHDKMTANWQLITDFFHKLGVILNVVNGQRAQDNVKLIRQLINRLHVHPAISDPLVGRLCCCLSQHFSGGINAEDTFGAMLSSIAAMPTIATA